MRMRPPFRTRMASLRSTLSNRAISRRPWRRLDRRGTVLHCALNHLPQVGRVLMLVYGYSMLDRSLQQFGLAVGAQRDRAVHFTREGTAVDKLASDHFLRITGV